MTKTLLASAATAAVCFIITSTTGFAASKGRTITFGPNDYLYVPSIQKPGGLDCGIQRYFGALGFVCTDGGPIPTGANVTWYSNRVEIESDQSPTSFIRTYPGGSRVHVWRFHAVEP